MSVTTVSAQKFGDVVEKFIRGKFTPEQKSDAKFLSLELSQMSAADFADVAERLHGCLPANLISVYGSAPNSVPQLIAWALAFEELGIAGLEDDEVLSPRHRVSRRSIPPVRTDDAPTAPQQKVSVAGSKVEGAISESQRSLEVTKVEHAHMEGLASRVSAMEKVLFGLTRRLDDLLSKPPAAGIVEPASKPEQRRVHVRARAGAKIARGSGQRSSSSDTASSETCPGSDDTPSGADSDDIVAALELLRTREKPKSGGAREPAGSLRTNAAELSSTSSDTPEMDEPSYYMRGVRHFVSEGIHPVRDPSSWAHFKTAYLRTLVYRLPPQQRGAATAIIPLLKAALKDPNALTGRAVKAVDKQLRDFATIVQEGKEIAMVVKSQYAAEKMPVEHKRKVLTARALVARRRQLQGGPPDVIPPKLLGAGGELELDDSDIALAVSKYPIDTAVPEPSPENGTAPAGGSRGRGRGRKGRK